MNTLTQVENRSGVTINRDGVTTAFEVILEELDTVTKEVNSQGADFIKSGKYVEAQRIIESGKQLLVFREQLFGLKSEWLTGHDVSIRQRVQINNIRNISPRRKATRTGLSVTCPNGRVIHHHFAADTFVEVLQYLGIERVKTLNIRVNGVPLVSTHKDDKYSQKELGTYWIMTHSNTEAKKMLLTSIADRLGVHLSMKIVKSPSEPGIGRNIRFP